MPLCSLHALSRCAQDGPFLAMDWGKKRIGFAISDGKRRVAMPLHSMDALSWKKIFFFLSTVRAERNVQGFLIGWPFLQAYEEEARPEEKKLRNFIEACVAYDAWSVALWNERYTTREVQYWCPETVKHVDAHAAALFLQGALDYLRIHGSEGGIT